MKKTIILLLAAFITVTSYGQNFYFPKENYQDSAVFAKAIPGLAAQLQEHYISLNDPNSALNKMDLDLAMARYDEAMVHLNEWRQQFAVEIRPIAYLPFDVYISAKLEQPQLTATAFLTLFESRFRETFNALNTNSKELSTMYNGPYEVQKRALETMKERGKKSDSLNLGSATRMIALYNAYQIKKLTTAIMQKVVDEEYFYTFDMQSPIIKTNNGHQFQAHVVKPKGVSEKLPTVFIFNIYADSLDDISRARYYADKGYAGVVINTRGKAIKGPEVAPFEFDSQDAYELIDWISNQSWSNGKVGMVGGSYLGFAQWSALKKPHPALKTIMPQVSVGPGIDYPMTSNVFMTYMIRWINYVTGSGREATWDFSNTEKWFKLYKDWYEKGTAFNAVDSLEGRPNPVFQRWLKHPSYDSFWQDMVPYQSEFAQIDIPILSITGYYDSDQAGALYYHRQHLKYKPDANHYLVIGPYDHYGAQQYPTETIHGYKVDSVATSFNFRNLSVEWFDYILKNGSKPVVLKDRVNYQVMGTNEWRHTDEMSHISNDTLTFYFSSNLKGEHYSLTANAGDGFVEQTVDFSDRSDVQIFKYNIIKDSITADLSNAKSFISEPIQESLSINGAYVSTLMATINKKDFDVAMRVYELRPDGKYFALYSTFRGLANVQRASYSKDNTQRQLLTPGRKESVLMRNTSFTSKQLSKGSRLVVVLGVNKSPQWQLNYGTGKDVSEETIADAKEPLNVKWYGDSYIKFPIFRTGKEK